MFRAIAFAGLLMASVAPVVSQAAMLQLITGDEATRPARPAVTLTKRAGVTRGPTLTVKGLSEKTPAQSPVPLNIEIKTYGGAALDTSSLRFTYLREPEVDLTDRLRPYLSNGKIDVPAQIPPGEHQIRVDLKDTEGRTNTAFITIKVAQ